MIPILPLNIIGLRNNTEHIYRYTNEKIHNKNIKLIGQKIIRELNYGGSPDTLFYITAFFTRHCRYTTTPKKPSSLPSLSFSRIDRVFSYTVRQLAQLLHYKSHFTRYNTELFIGHHFVSIYIDIYKQSFIWNYECINWKVCYPNFMPLWCTALALWFGEARTLSEEEYFR